MVEIEGLNTADRKALASALVNESRKYSEAGRDFLRSLQELGLDPEALVWAFEPDENYRFVLVLITAFFDFAGPLEISRMLFKAYNASALPNQIDPLMVRLHSPRQKFAQNLLKLQQNLQTKEHNKPMLAPGHLFVDDSIAWTVDGVLKWPSKISRTIEQGRKWERFSRNVHLLAA